MAAKISENYQSRGFSYARYASRTLVFDVVGTEDETEVSALVLATAPAGYLGLTIETVTCEPQGNGVWKATVTYEKLQNTNDYTFGTGGGTRHMSQSLGTVGKYTNLPAAPDFQRAINVADNRVEGVELPGPRYEFSETHYLPDAIVTPSYKFLLAGMSGLSFNNAGFKSFAAGEVALMGVSGAKRGDDQWGLTFTFSCSPNATGLTVGGEVDWTTDPPTSTGGISGIDKLGWDYLWVLYGTFEDSDSKQLVERPVAVYVERVLTPRDYSLLGIGV